MAEQGLQGFLLQGFITLEYFYLFSYRRLYEEEIAGKSFMHLPESLLAWVENGLSSDLDAELRKHTLTI